MAGARQDGQAGGGDGALEHQRGLQAALVLVAHQDQDRDAHPGQFVGERVQRGPGGLEAATAGWTDIPATAGVSGSGAGTFTGPGS